MQSARFLESFQAASLGQELQSPVGWFAVDGAFAALVWSAKSLECFDGISGARAKVTRDVMLT